ncbi:MULTISPECIES: glycosyltransferase [unclassified Myroides]|uniref:glycosyltransferase n=1 Tax=unclassified Myroides TaxID=2642485 RepID=UPI003D2F7DCE
MEFKKLKILYIGTSLSGGGGVARIISQKTAAFIQAGHHVHIISTNDRSTQPFYAFDPAVHFSWYPKPIRTILQMKRYYDFVNQVVISRFQPDVVIVIDNGIKGYCASYLLKTQAPIYFEVHGSRNFLLSPITSKIKRVLVDRLTLALSKRFTGLILLNTSSAKDWQHRNVTVIPNWIEQKNTSVVAEKKHTKQILAIGRIVPEKNYEELLAIWREIQQLRPDWQLVVCGTGEVGYVDKIKKIATDNVTWKGEVALIQHEIQHSAFVLHTSKMEGMPMAFLEAMVLGVPVVAYDVPYGPADLITSGINGYLVPFGDQRSMIQRCLELIDQPSVVQQFGEQAKQAVKVYDKTLVLQQWFSFFEQLGSLCGKHSI